MHLYFKTNTQGTLLKNVAGINKFDCFPPYLVCHITYPVGTLFTVFALEIDHGLQIQRFHFSFSTKSSS